MEKQVYYPNEYLSNRELDNFDRVLLIYLLSYYNFKNGVDINYLFIPGLYEQMFAQSFYELTPTQRSSFTNKIDGSLKRLVELEFISITIRKERNFYIINSINKDEEGTFTMFSLNEVNKILRATNSCILVFYYVSLLKSRNFSLVIGDKRGAVGYMPMSFFAKILNRSIKSVMAYNKQLEDLGVIYIRHSQREGVPNAYGLPEDKTRVNEYYLQYYSFDKTKGINRRRALMQKYNNAIRNGIKYSKEEIKQINDYIEWRNKSGKYDYTLPLL